MPDYGDLIILTNPKGKRYLRRLEEKQDIHGNDGIILASDIKDAEYGSELISSKNVPYRLKRVTLHDLLTGLKRQTQIIYPKDSAYLCMRLGVGNGKKVIEAGSGSGSLTLALSWFAGEKGIVYTYEAREEFYNVCKKNLAWAGLGHNVVQYNRDIAEGFEQTDADALFLDVRTPWEYLDKILAAVKPGGSFAFLVPTVDQINKLLTAMEQKDFDDIEVSEILIRKWKPVADRLRPDDRMIAHTGFLIFARHQKRSELWDSQKPLGTRERKQEAAKKERLEASESEVLSGDILSGE
ncbi:tRNA (adenine-N1)-methyltransferase [Desulfovibrio litoralis]|uniref:tRNA (adenine(58)-N(1))-methyltransferase TrmI n=1 Tax=Desulfovibrio litoralis DSM 11393 TaxID=1121455 RepID=A0A1M7TMQ4_9BACT|nr:tRNA (adenine-N1)-methyltransferase [Desulfovibrio litoralis]SHN71995.1 tRNA (adenine57-N1/adenine58-N1)-methyltransferase [Desulfovibrio litoralis DSM 11393]